VERGDSLASAWPHARVVRAAPVLFACDAPTGRARGNGGREGRGAGTRAQDEDRKLWRHNRARCRGGWAPVSVLGLRRRRRRRLVARYVYVRWERARDGGMCLGLDPGWTSPAGDGGGDGTRDAGPSCSVGEQRPPSLDQI
jgi:hypothetical protein